MKQVYLDYNASTPIAAEVAASMRPFLEGSYGNPSSRHWASATLKPAIAAARAKISIALGCRAGEVVFTSSGTEASNLAIKGLFFAHWGKPFHVITTAVEHAATLGPCRFIQSLGAELTVLPVDGYGRVDPAAVENAILPHTRLVSVMHAQNEVGTIQPIAEIGRIAKERGIVFHVDAAQSLGKIPLAVDELHADLLSITGQKVYAPKGVGALYKREGIELRPLIHGPVSHENGMRSGTESALLDVALGTACGLVDARCAAEADRLRSLRDYLHDGLVDVLGDRLRLNGHPIERLPNTLNLSFRDLLGSELLERMPEIAASTGSACHSGANTMSPVLTAMGIESRWGLGSIRFSLGKESCREEIDFVLEQFRSVFSTTFS